MLLGLSMRWSDIATYAIWQLRAHGRKNLSLFLFSFVTMSLFVATLLYLDSLKTYMLDSYTKKPDIIVQGFKGGREVDIDNTKLQTIGNIIGVSSVSPRVNGRYYYEQNRYFNVVGIDFFDDIGFEVAQHLGVEIEPFYQKTQMLVGSNVDHELKRLYYDDFYLFKQNKQSHRVEVYKCIEAKSDWYLNNSMVMDIATARTVLGLQPTQSSDIAVRVGNKLEIEKVANEIRYLLDDVKLVVKKDEVLSLHNIFNLKGGFFIIFYLSSFMGLFFLIGIKYNTLSLMAKKEVAILRTLGFGIGDVVKIKLFEALMVGLMAFVSAVVVSVWYLEYANISLFASIFFDPNLMGYTPRIEIIASYKIIFLSFVLFFAPYALIVIYPIFRLSTSEPVEVLK